MKSSLKTLSLAVILLISNDSQAIRLHNEQTGIFSTMINQVEETTLAKQDIEAAKERKRVQLAEAEKEHEVAVQQEE